MKKIAVILLLLIYGTATMGATIHMHYCMDEFVGWSLWHSKKDSKCGKCGMTEKKGGCCKDEHKSLKVKTEHQKGDAVKYIQVVLSPALANAETAYPQNILYKPVTIYYPVSHAPPQQDRPLFIQYCVFLI